MQKVAALQLCSSHLVTENFSVAKKFINEAATNGSKLIVLPEMFAIMGTDTINKVTEKENFGSGKIQDFLAEQARINKVWLVGGTIPIADADKNKIRAACLVYNDQGQLVARYDKIHMFDVMLSPTESYRESATTAPGNEVIVIGTPVGKLGLAVCFDIRFPDLFQQLNKKGAEIIAIPAAFTVKTGQAHWYALARARAIENFCYVIGACQGGTHSSGRTTYGHSLIVNPWGTVVAEKNDDNPGIIYSEIDLNYLKDIRKAIPI